MIASENLAWSLFAFDRYAQLAGASANALGDVVGQVTAATTPKQLAADVADAYFNHPLLQSYPRTISVLDLGKTTLVSQKVDALAAALRNSLSSTKNAVRSARDAAQKFDSRDYYRITNDDEYLDLYDFAARVKLYVSDSAVKTAAQNVMDAVAGGFVVRERHQSGIYTGGAGEIYWGLDGAHGVSIYFPPRSGASNADYGKYVTHQLFRFTADTAWDDFLTDYFGLIGLPPEPYVDPGLAPMLEPVYKVYLPMVLGVVDLSSNPFRPYRADR